MNKDSVVYVIIFSFIVTFVFVFALSFVDVVTKPTVLDNEKLAKYQAVLSALGADFVEGDKESVFEAYENVTQKSADESTYYELTVGGETSYALELQGAGLWGTIEVIVGFNSDITSFNGLEIVTHNETPGLGGRIEEEWFRGQFVDQVIPESLSSDAAIAFKAGSGSGDPNKDDAEVDGITGASRTTESMRDIIDDAVRTMRTVVGGSI